MKTIILIVFAFIGLNANAQIKKITLQASGLTCSMCSNSINKALKTLDFVEQVEPNIKMSSFVISIKENTIADIDKVKNKVEDAGFFVAKMLVAVNFNDTKIENDKHAVIGKEVFHFLNVQNQQLKGEYTIKLLDKGFVTSKEFKKNSKLTAMQCYTTGKAAKCCVGEGISEGQRIYHVTLAP